MRTDEKLLRIDQKEGGFGKVPKPKIVLPAPLIGPVELAEYVNVPLATVYTWNYEGTGPKCIKIGRHCRYRWSDVENWLVQRGGAA